MQKGRGGMGSHKHGVSGCVGPNRRALQGLARLVNQQADEKNKKRAKPQMFDTMEELMKAQKKKK